MDAAKFFTACWVNSTYLLEGAEWLAVLEDHHILLISVDSLPCNARFACRSENVHIPFSFNNNNFSLLSTKTQTILCSFCSITLKLLYDFFLTLTSISEIILPALVFTCSSLFYRVWILWVFVMELL